MTASRVVSHPGAIEDRFSIDEYPVRCLEQLHQLGQWNGSDQIGDPRRIDVVEQHYGLISIHLDTQLVPEKVELLPVIVWDLLRWHAIRSERFSHPRSAN